MVPVPSTVLSKKLYRITSRSDAFLLFRILSRILLSLFLMNWFPYLIKGDRKKNYLSLFIPILDFRTSPGDSVGLNVEEKMAKKKTYTPTHTSTSIALNTIKNSTSLYEIKYIHSFNQQQFRQHNRKIINLMWFRIQIRHVSNFMYISKG